MYFVIVCMYMFLRIKKCPNLSIIHNNCDVLRVASPELSTLALVIASHLPILYYMHTCTFCAISLMRHNIHIRTTNNSYILHTLSANNIQFIFCFILDGKIKLILCYIFNWRWPQKEFKERIKHELLHEQFPAKEFVRYFAGDIVCNTTTQYHQLNTWFWGDK